ncbi:CsbD family protein [Paraburkholderia guartelaensis]|uniref:CsbD family protein n=1 Tax=Paraburkholderia guartelaensis TaxID=2546446 RepID=UPI002AB7E1E1|nr:CsbD family protein [Paraburkholderia guartelaensis]
MTSEKVEGIAKEIAGEAQEKVGAALNDPAMELAGTAKVLCGESRQLVADAAVVAREAIAESPLRVLGITAAIGFALGLLWRRSRD